MKIERFEQLAVAKQPGSDNVAKIVKWKDFIANTQDTSTHEEYTPPEEPNIVEYDEWMDW